jgi:hypothetical protein
MSAGTLRKRPTSCEVARKMVENRTTSPSQFDTAQTLPSHFLGEGPGVRGRTSSDSEALCCSALHPSFSQEERHHSELQFTPYFHHPRGSS